MKKTIVGMKNKNQSDMSNSKVLKEVIAMGYITENKIIKADHRSKRQKVNFFNASFYFHISPFTLTFTCKFIFLSIYTITKSHQSLTANSAILTRSLPMKIYVI